MSIRTFRIINQEGERRICVIDGQPYYQSTGRNSQMPGAWLPFERFAAPNKRTGMMHKPFSGPNVVTRIEDHFPSIVVNAIIEQYGNGTEWHRFKNIKCLYTACLLTPESNTAIPPGIRAAVRAYVMGDDSQHLMPNAHFVLQAEPERRLDLTRTRTVPLTTQDYQDLTSVLDGMGANIGPVVEEDNLMNPLHVQEELSNLDDMSHDFRAYVNNTRANAPDAEQKAINALTDQPNGFPGLESHFVNIEQRYAAQYTVRAYITHVYKSIMKGVRQLDPRNCMKGDGPSNSDDQDPPNNAL